jgi:CheY-like chemotaxis protein
MAERARRTEHDLILMDVNIPVMDALEATRRIRQLPNRSGLPIFAVTENAIIQDQQRSGAPGIDDFLPKPEDPEVMFANLLKSLERRGPYPVLVPSIWAGRAGRLSKMVDERIP